LTGASESLGARYAETEGGDMPEATAATHAATLIEYAIQAGTTAWNGR